MTLNRRDLLSAAGLGALYLGAPALWRSGVAQAAVPRDAFDVMTLDQIVKSLGGNGVTESTDIEFRAPEIAENGAVVPLEVTSAIPGTIGIGFVVEKNPHPLSAFFSLPQGTEPYISTRIKVSETSDVIALVRTDKGFFATRRLVKVTLGGCGG